MPQESFQDSYSGIYSLDLVLLVFEMALYGS